MTLKTTSYLSPDGKLQKNYAGDLSPETLVRIYCNMHKTRHIDERMVTLQRQSHVNFAMSSRGEEGCVTASAAALSSSDWLYFQYREQAAIFWRGLSAQDYIHHMFLNVKDESLGRQMSNHFGSHKLNCMTVSSPLATQLPHAAGCAYAMKVRGDQAVSLCYFGEGSASEGDFHGALNMAAVTKSPCIFFCRNNHYAISTPSDAQYAGDGIAPRAAGYGIKAFRVDGNDVFAVYEATKEAKEICLRGEGPILIEAMTYRLGAHSTADDPSAYRSDDEVKKWEAGEPLNRLGNWLRAEGHWDDVKEEAFLKDLRSEVKEAVEVARNTPKPTHETMFTDVYAEMPETLNEQFEWLKKFKEDE
jgi:pyruvate dehydrogenase E1 component alpha subunit